MSTRTRGLCIALAALAVALLDCRQGIFPLDEGTVLNAGHAVLTGRTLYQDCHVNYGPGVPWTLALLFRAFGTDVLWARLFTAACFVAFVLVVRGLLAGPLADVAPLSLVGLRAFFYPYWVMVSYTPSALLLYLTALRAVLAGRYLLAGALAGGAFVFKQNIGGMAVLVTACAAAIQAHTAGGRPGPAVVRAAAGAAMVGAGMIALLAATSTLPGYYQDAVVDNVNLGAFWKVPYPAFLPEAELRARIFAYLPSRLFSLHFSHPRLMERAAVAAALPTFARIFFLLPPILVALALARGLHRARRHPGDPRRGRLLVLAIGAAGLLPAAWPSTTALHFTTPMAGSLLAAGAWAEGCRRRERLAGAGLLAAGALGLLLSALAHSWERSPVSFRTGKLFVDAASAARYQSVLDHLERELPPGAPILVVPYHPFYYFASGHPNPTSDDLLLPPWFAGERLEATVALVRKGGVPAILWSRSEFPTIGKFRSYAAPLADAIEERYALSLRKPPDQVWRPKE